MHGPLEGQTTSVKCPTGELWTSPAFCSSICFKRLRASSSRSRPGRRACSKMATLSTPSNVSQHSQASIKWRSMDSLARTASTCDFREFQQNHDICSTNSIPFHGPCRSISTIDRFSWTDANHDANHPWRERSCYSPSPANGPVVRAWSARFLKSCASSSSCDETPCNSSPRTLEV